MITDDPRTAARQWFEHNIIRRMNASFNETPENLAHIEIIRAVLSPDAQGPLIGIIANFLTTAEQGKALAFVHNGRKFLMQAGALLEDSK